MKREKREDKQGMKRKRKSESWKERCKIIIRRNKRKGQKRDGQYIMVEEPKTQHSLLLSITPGRMGQRLTQVRDVSLKCASSTNSGTAFEQATHLALTECISNTTNVTVSWNSLT